MRRILLTSSLLLTTVTCIAAQDTPEPARGARIREPAFTDPTVIKEDDTFHLVLSREMPTPGWTFKIDSVEASNHRITIKVTEVGPKGMVAQVLSKARLKASLGNLEPATYFVELQLRRNPDSDHTPVQAIVLHAYR